MLNSEQPDAIQPAEPVPSTRNDTRSASAGIIVSDYQLIRRIGAGAYGDVWLAQSVLGHLRAVKLVYRSRFAEERPFQREFEGIQRFEPISRSHLSQLAILHVGKNEAGGCFYYVMELADDVSAECGMRSAGPSSAERGVRSVECEDRMVEGAQTSTPHSALRTPHSYVPHTLRHDLEQHGRLPIAECVEIGLSLTTALAHLHQHGLVHRDIKPSNVIFVNRAPKLGDIGLVTEAGDTNSIVGTEGYIPPEGPGTPQADIFSLGKVLYEISTGMDRRRFSELPDDLRSWPDRGAVVEFNEIVLRACAKDPARRYQSAEQMRADLELLEEGRSVSQKRAVERRWQVFKRLAPVGAAVLGVLSIPLGFRWFMPPPAPLAPRVEKRSTNEVANQMYDLGNVYLDGSKFQKAAEQFELSVQADPSFARAYARLAWVHTWTEGETNGWNFEWQFRDKAMAEAKKALELDPTLAEPHCVLAAYHLLGEWDWKAAEREHRLAVQLDPNSASSRYSLSEYLRIVGRAEEALAELAKAQALDPNSIIVNSRLASFYADARKFQESLAQLELVKARDPKQEMVELRSRVLCALGRYPEAVESLRRARIDRGEPRERVDEEFDRIRHDVEAGDTKSFWRQQLTKAREQNDAFWQACAWAQLMETNQAIACLEQARDARAWRLTFSVMTDWRLDPVRSEPRFHGVLKSIHFE